MMANYKEFWYTSWRSMMSRCCNQNAKNYKYYGGKGICVCDEWKSPETFGVWACSSGWFKGATLDRIDNSKGYSPENCKWSTKKEQATNRSTTVFIEACGERHSLTEWSEILGINRKTLINRYDKGDRGEYLFRPVEPSYNGWSWVIDGGKRKWVKGT